MQTTEQPDLGQLFTKLDKVATGVENLTRSFSGEKIDTFLGPLTDFVKDNRTNLTATIANIRTVSDRIAEGQGTVGKLINESTLYISAQNAISNLQSVGGDVKAVAADAHTLLTNANQVVTDARTGQGTRGQVVDRRHASTCEATGAMTNLHSILIKIDQGQGTVGQLINDDTLPQRRQALPAKAGQSHREPGRHRPAEHPWDDGQQFVLIELSLGRNWAGFKQQADSLAKVMEAFVLGFALPVGAWYFQTSRPKTAFGGLALM